MKKLLLFLFLNSYFGFSQKIMIGLFADHTLRSVDISFQNGLYIIFTDSTLQRITDSSGTHLKIEATEKGLRLNIAGVIYNCNSIKLIPEKVSNFFRIKPLNSNLKERLYEGELHVEKTEKNNLKIMNFIEMNDYLEGVVESEAGRGQLFEYYKVQSIISRTFALRNWNKHDKDGFNLCDQVHCQAYLHKRNAPKNTIDSAVNATSNFVLTYQDTSFAPTFFHANCGGQISDPEWVWNSSIGGLCTFNDPYCMNTKQGTWTKYIPLTVWKDYFKKTYDFPIEDSAYFSLLTNFKQDQRMSFFIHPQFGIPLRDIREEFRLKSTYFSVKLEGNNVVLIGRGFGHGVGLCQDGAMQMAKSGYSSEEILYFYYPNTRLREQNPIRK
ncbi:MAG: SpoIID/LytB domain-containing protein [Bacteroidetes bacterium]|nr:SpoIID/LytB domain-containing protein [Bacteroidota bacterium]